MASPFASQTQSDRIPLPWDQAQWVIVRRLTGRELEAAAVAHRDTLASASPRAWPMQLRRMLEKGATDPEVQQAITDPLLGYDRYKLVRSGLVAWSYPQSLKVIAAKAAVLDLSGKVITPAVEASDAVEDLDDDAVEFIAREVLKLTKPGLFHTTEEEAQAAQKNG